MIKKLRNRTDAVWDYIIFEADVQITKQLSRSVNDSAWLQIAIKIMNPVKYQVFSQIKDQVFDSLWFE